MFKSGKRATWGAVQQEVKDKFKLTSFGRSATAMASAQAPTPEHAGGAPSLPAQVEEDIAYAVRSLPR